LASTNVITSGVQVYRYDFPAIDTYPSGDFSDTDSISQIASETLALKEVVSEFAESVNIVGGLKVDTITTTGNVDISGSLTCNSLNINKKSIFIGDFDFDFDTIVIRRPTNIGTGRFIGIREVQLFVNNVNVLPDLVSQSTFNVDGTPLQDISNIPFFIDWSDKTLDPYHSNYYPSNVVNEIIDSGGHLYSAYWGIIDGTVTVYNTDVGLYIPMSDKINIKDIQSAIIYNRPNGYDFFVGCAIELYNRSNDPNLETPLSSTNLITTAEDVYRFDYPAIDTYTGDFSDTDSISQIASETLALKEVVSEFAESVNIVGGLNVDTIATTGNVIIGRQLYCDLDAFHYSAEATDYTKGVGADVSWTRTSRGSTIKNGDSFRPKYTGKYSITLCLYFGPNSTGEAKVGLKLNGSAYNLNGGTTLIVSASGANRYVNMFTGNLIVDAVAGENIKAYVQRGTLRYYGERCYFAGYYIGNT